MTESASSKRQARRRAWYRYRKRIAALNMAINRAKSAKKRARRKYLAERERIYSGGDNEVRAEDLHALWQHE